MREEIKKLFIDSPNTFISGEEIAKKLNISRTAIWKHIDHLKKEGYVFEAVRKKGYRLINNPDDIFAMRINEGLLTDWLGKEVNYQKELESTQKLAHDLAKNGATHGTIVIADTQTKGKGRLGRRWHSAEGKGIWLSIILRPAFTFLQAPLITLLTSLAIKDTLDVYQVNGKIKWPNDVYIENKKLSGILTEVHGEQDKIDYMIIGIGINTHKADYPEEIKNSAISIEEVIGYPPNRTMIIKELLQNFEIKYKQFLESGFDYFYNSYNKHLMRLNKHVVINNNQKQISGVNLGINKDGFLLLQSENEIIKVVSGDITV